MGRTSLAVEKIDRLVSQILENERSSQGIPFRKLAEMSGVSTTRLHALLSAERPITVGELDDVAKCLGLVGWRVHQEAEEKLRPSLSVVPDILAGPDVEQAAAYGHDLEDDPDPA